MTGSRRRLLALTLVAVGVAACGSTAGDDGGGDTGGAAGADAGAAGADADVGDSSPEAAADAPGCDCVTAPPGWDGPFEARVDDTARYCAGGGTPAIVLHADVTSDAIGCECSCGYSATCDSVRMASHDGAPCGSETASVVLPLDACVDLPLPAPTFARIVTGATTGSCQPSARAIWSTTPTWARTLSLCRPVAECAGGACPDPAGGAACVLREGDHPCTDDFPRRATWFTDYDDRRTCDDSECTCDAPTCVGHALVFSEAACAGDAEVVEIPRGCQPPPPRASARLYDALAVCEPRGESTTRGAAVPTGERTVCCR